MPAVRDHIPVFLPDDLPSIGHNRHCRQRFTAKLHLLGDETEPSISQQCHSPHRISAVPTFTSVHLL